MRGAGLSALVVVGWLLGGTGFGAEVNLQSGPARVHLLELFTSEGCSSCPPAEKWFSTLRPSPRLWKDFVPVSFHVDYWDGLGWKDALASKAFTSRQYRYAVSWGMTSVYTPGYVLDGREWRGADVSRLPAAGGPAGTLTATWRETGEVQILFSPSAKSAAHWQANAALLAFGVGADVKGGENAGRKLVHDFVALAAEQAPMTDEAQGARATINLPAARAKHGQSALAVWVVEAGKVEPVQAAGANL
jgi:hypothetical protein